MIVKTTSYCCRKDGGLIDEHFLRRRFKPQLTTLIKILSATPPKEAFQMQIKR